VPVDLGGPALAREAFLLPSADFWREELPRVRGQRYLAFDLAGTAYALPLSYVREVERVPPLAPLPNVPPWVLGAASLRGDIISAVDLAAFLGLAAGERLQGRPSFSREARLLACRAGSMEAGLVIERVRDIRQLPDASIRPPTGTIPGRAARFLAGTHVSDGRLTLLLDLPRLLNSAEFRRFE
jgi:chemotaxis signal transduction protein